MRTALLAWLAIPALALTATPLNIRPAYANGDRVRNMAYKSHPRWGYSYLQWCNRELPTPLNQQESVTLMQINRMLSYLGAIRTKAQRQARMTQCERYDLFVKNELRSLALNGLQLEELSPLFSLLEATKLEGVFLDGQGLEQTDIDLMGFFDEIPLMRAVTLPRNETGRVGDCPLARVRFL